MLPPPSPIAVVAAVIEDGAGRVLVAQRPAHQHLASKRECPGAKIAPGETPEAALARPLELATARGALVVTQRPAPGEGQLLLLTLRERPAPPSPAQLAPLGLTPRETEILFWVAQGKTSPEIALILDTALETIKRHVKNFLPKLGVETRLAAALKAMELLGPPA